MKLKLSQKILLMAVCVGVLNGAIVGTLSYLKAREIQDDLNNQMMIAIINQKNQSIKSYLNSIREDIMVISTNATVQEAIYKFKNAWEGLGGNQKEILQSLYIDNNPHPTGKKEQLDFALDNSIYSQTHKDYHPWFRTVLKTRGYYDVFLFDLDGNLLYTVFKELDFATNLNTGEWKNTDLGNAYRAALEAKTPGEQFFLDFRPYAPSHGAAASFIATPLFDKNRNKIGVLVFQMPIDRINEVMESNVGKDKTAESYLVGRDYLMRSNSRFTKVGETSLLKTRVQTPAVEYALKGESGYIEQTSYRGVPTIAAYQPFEFMGSHWALIAERLANNEAVNTLRNFLFILSIITIILVLLGLNFLIRTITTPLKILIQDMFCLARGDHNISNSYADRDDELGEWL